MTEESTIKVQKDKIFDSDNYTESDGYAKVDRRISPVQIMGIDSSGNLTAPEIIDSNGSLKVVESLQVEKHLPVAASDTLITVPAGEVWRIEEIYFAGLADVNPANRSMTLSVTRTIGVFGATIIITSAIVISALETGAITLTAGQTPNHFTSDAGVIAIVANENALPFTLTGAADTIAGISTNKQAGDVFELEVRYHLVP